MLLVLVKREFPQDFKFSAVMEALSFTLGWETYFTKIQHPFAALFTL